MKAVMYHYVREPNDLLPHFKYLHVDDFRQQLQYFQDHYTLLSKDTFLESIQTNSPIENGIILTFDDGLKDHHQYVLPLLEEFNTFGIFYIPTYPYISQNVLDVHRTHILLGHCDSDALVTSITERITESDLDQEHVDEFKSITYRSQNNSDSTLHFKRLLNYFIKYESRSRILDTLVDTHLNDVKHLLDAIYMTESEINDLQNSGMIVGSHTIHHPVMSRLSLPEQAHEIKESFNRIESMVGRLSVKTFCYPYGGFHTFTPDTMSLLNDEGCLFSFNVESRDISKDDIQNQPHALPRYDCNTFPYGQCR